MEPSDPRSSDDVFGVPPELEEAHTHRSRVYFPESPSPTRRKPYSAEGSSMHAHISSPLRRGSPLNPQRASNQDRRHPSSNDPLNPASEPLFRLRRSPLLVPMDDTNFRSIPEQESGVNEVNVFSEEYDLCKLPYYPYSASFFNSGL